MTKFLIQTPTDKAYVTNAAVPRLFKLVPSQLSRTNSPNLNHFRPPSSTNARKECLLYHFCLHFSICILNFM